MLKQLSRQNAVRKKRKDRGQTLGLFLMALPMMIVVTIFSYIPMGGLIVAFKDYSYRDGLLKSPFSDPFWKNFEFLFKSPDTFRIIRNTLRNKARMLTCIIGIAFCMALVVAAFGLRDAITRYADALTKNQNRYDLIVTLSSGTQQSQWNRLSHSSAVTAAEFEMTTACWI